MKEKELNLSKLEEHATHLFHIMIAPRGHPSMAVQIILHLIQTQEFIDILSLSLVVNARLLLIKLYRFDPCSANETTFVISRPGDA